MIQIETVKIRLLSVILSIAAAEGVKIIVFLGFFGVRVIPDSVIFGEVNIMSAF